MKSLYYLLILFIVIMSCQNEKSEPVEEAMSIQWSLDSINAAFETQTFATFHITNNSSQDLVPGSWSLHYNQIGGRPDQTKLTGEFNYENPAGDYIIIKPTSTFGSITAGETKSLSYVINGHVDKMSEVPKGVFAVIDSKATEILPTKIVGMNANTLAVINPTTPATRYEEFRRLTQVPEDELQPFFPSPSFFTREKGETQIAKEIKLFMPKEAEGVFDIIQSHSKWLGCTFEKSNKEEANIIFELRSGSDTNPEAYQLKNDGQILVEASDPNGLFYGAQSLLQLLYSNTTEDGFVIPHMFVNDKPRFGYRGMHLDVSRNFHSVNQVKKIIDMMAFFKLNTFHFHITDDEGWRLEIPGLPELTTVGASRGYTTDESNQLYPAYGSGPNPKKSYGSGYYTREEYIDILRYAKDRYVDVIPEIDVPGHSRAAIKAMRARYNSFIGAGNYDKANEYLLDDENDTSEYSSAQGYSDNVVCVCQDGAYNFMEKVLSEVIEMYKDADATLNILHVGGDEIPHGAWEKSPICNEFIRNHSDLENTADLQAYFFNKMKDYLDNKNIKMAGWEEIMLKRDDQGHNTTAIDQSQIDGQSIPYVWNAVWGWGREDMIYKLANAGSPVILSNSAAYYFDMAYDKRSE